MKVWQDHADPVLSELSKMLINRRLFKIEMQGEAFSPEYINKVKNATAGFLGLPEADTAFFVLNDTTTNYAYDPYSANINILNKEGWIKDIAEASDLLDASLVSRPVTKYFLCYPKGLAIVDN